jgi:hypothetical protein
VKAPLSRRLLAAILSGAVVAGGAVAAAPVLAAGPVDSPVLTPLVLTEPSVEPPGEPGEPSVPGPDPEITSESPSPDASSASPDAPPPGPEPEPEIPSAPPSSPAVPSSPVSSSPATSPATTPVTSKPVSPSPAKPADRVAPFGVFKLSGTAFWAGQWVTFTQRASDFGDLVSVDAKITRRIDWGDGTAITLGATATSASKQYARAGRFTVTETLTDEAKNVHRITQVVAVTIPGTYKLTRTSVYQGVSFGVNVSNVPAGTKDIVINWGDGAVTGHPGKNGRIDYYFLKHAKTGKRISGNFPIKIAFGNANGYSAYQPVGTVKVVADNTKPVLRINKPVKPSRASSWRTVTGTVTETQSGAPYVYATVLWANTAGATYCLTPDRKWKRYTSDAQLMKLCADKGVRVAVSKGKWTLSVPAGLRKGNLLAWAWTWDWAENYGDATRQATITKQ